MKYFVDAEGRSIELDIEEHPDGTFRVVAPDGVHRADYVETQRHEVSLILDGRSRVLWFDGQNGATRVSVGPVSLEVSVEDERAHWEASFLGRKAAGAGGEVRSIMPGIVTRLLVSEGDVVEAGAALLCVEAMKMENEVKSEEAGRVVKIRVAPGATVATGEVLVELEDPGAAR